MAKREQAAPRRRVRGTGSIFFHAARGVWVGRKRVAGVVVQRSHASQSEMLRLLDLATPPGPGVTVAQWCGRWLASLACRGATAKIRANAVRLYFVPSLGPLKLAAVTPRHVELAAADWARTLASPNTLRMHLAALHTCFQAAVKEGVIPENPVKRAQRPKGRKANIDPFTGPELAAIVAGAARRPACRVFALLASTGCRVGEALGLDAADFDPAAGTVAITRTQQPDRSRGPTKSANGVRTVRVPAAALPAVRDAHAGRKGGALFRSQAGGRACHRLVTRSWKWMLKRLGLRYRNLHQLRHSVASHALAAGYGPADVAKYLGDSPETIIRTYCHATGQDVAGAMDDLLSAAAPRVSPGRKNKSGILWPHT